jgi:peptide-methionine (S)-S-oxide reductase
MFAKTNRLEIPDARHALTGRAEEMDFLDRHFVNGRTMKNNLPSDKEKVAFGLGCFWGAERKFWELDGVYSTAVGYCDGHTPNPTYTEVCSGMTGHNEVVLVIYDSTIVDYGTLLKVFWENHDPTQGMRQGNDIGTQYRSGIYIHNMEKMDESTNSLSKYNKTLIDAGYSKITTEIKEMITFYYAEEYHQQYLAKNPTGYCGLGGTGVQYPNL